MSLNFLSFTKQARDLKNVNYKGYLYHNELMGKLKEYHVSVHPSTFEETFCISAMEALAAGCMLNNHGPRGYTLKPVQNFQFIFLIQQIKGSFSCSNS